jgi:predicted metalloprotease with PDZ domain
MLPYDYTKENYFRTGFVAEGVTTYMGDLMLYKSGVFNWIEFVKTQNQNLERHLMNYGRFNLSVADSGFDNWLDGYKLGAPNRKVSIYPDGALCMLMVDLEIIKNTDGKYSLNSVMKELYDDYALNGLGYSENDFRNICVKYGGSEIVKIFESHIYGVKDYVPTLEKSLQIVGLNLKEKLNPNISAQYFGFIATKENGKYIIKKVEPNSIADINKIGPEDEIKEINNKKIDKPLNNILKDCKKEVSFTIKNKFSEKIMNLSCGNYYKLLEIDTVKNISTKQLKLRKIWCNK